MKLRLIGQRNVLGGGTLFANFVDALKALRTYGGLIEEINIGDEPQMRRAAEFSADSDVNIWFAFLAERIPQFRGTHVLWAVFESDKLPGPYVALLRREADAVWVPSRWGKGVLVANGIEADRIDVIPEGVSPASFHPHLRSAADRLEPPFRFLMVGKYEKRKGYEELLRGFKLAFGNSAAVQLVIKADYFLNFEPKKRALAELVRSQGIDNVKLLWGKMSTEELFTLYNACDVFVFPSRAEGWGLPLLEAAATGMPAISTFYSGHSHFLEHIDSSLARIDFTLEPIDDPDMHRAWPTADGDLGNWANPAAESIAACMLRVKADYRHFLPEGLQNSLLLREKFSWAAAVDKAAVALRDRGLFSPKYKIALP
jgi:glycosyltransferase involved in cell wall biosynthesis